MLKIIVDSLDQVDPKFHDLYEKGSDGKFHLKVEGVDLEAPNKVKEFRTNNIALKQENEQLKAKLEGIDVDEYQRLKAEAQKAEDQKKIDAGEIEALLNERTERMRADLQAKIDSLQKAYDKMKADKESLDGRLSEVLIDSEITKAVSKVGVLKKDAMDLVLSLAKKTWVLEDGHPIAKKDGKPIYGKDPSKQIDFDEWAQTVAMERPYLFESAEGLESRGGGERQGGSFGMNSTDFQKKSMGEKLEIASKIISGAGKR
jgi:hypothetical protein